MLTNTAFTTRPNLFVSTYFHNWSTELKEHLRQSGCPIELIDVIVFHSFRYGWKVNMNIVEFVQGKDYSKLITEVGGWINGGPKGSANITYTTQAAGIVTFANSFENVAGEKPSIPKIGSTAWEFLHPLCVNKTWDSKPCVNTNNLWLVKCDLARHMISIGKGNCK